MSKQKCGSIVNTASIAGHWGGCGGSVYSAAKAGVIHFSKVTSLELAKNKPNDQSLKNHYHHWQDVSLLWESISEGNKELGIPAYEGTIFSNNKDSFKKSSLTPFINSNIGFLEISSEKFFK